MACENQGRFAIVPELVKQFLGPRRELDAAWFLGMIGVVVPDVIEMGELGADAAEIVPDAGQNGFDLFGRFLRKGGREIFAADPVLAQPAADEARGAAEETGGLVRIEITRRAQQGDRQRADRCFRRRFGGVAKARLGAKEQAGYFLKQLSRFRGEGGTVR